MTPIEQRLVSALDEAAAAVAVPHSSVPFVGRAADRYIPGWRREPRRRTAVVLFVGALAIVLVLIAARLLSARDSSVPPTITPAPMILASDWIWPGDTDVAFPTAASVAAEFAREVLGLGGVRAEVDGSAPSNGPTWVTLHLPSGADLPILTYPLGSGAWVINQIGSDPMMVSYESGQYYVRFGTPDGASRARMSIRTADRTVSVAITAGDLQHGVVAIPEYARSVLIVFEDARGLTLAARGLHN
jgi:hypothetical protein